MGYYLLVFFLILSPHCIALHLYIHFLFTEILVSPVMISVIIFSLFPLHYVPSGGSIK